MPKIVKPNATQYPPKGQTVGYVRVSSFEQNESRQLEGLELGPESDWRPPSN